MSDPQISQIEIVLSGLMALLDKGKIIPGERLPSERRLCAMFGVSRSIVRLALQKLEFYGIVKTYPQSGSVLADYSTTVIRNQIRDMMDIDSFDFHSLVSVRIMLETEAVGLCAQNRTEDDLKALEAALEAFRESMYSDRRDEKDFAYHLAIAKASHNPVIASLLLSIAPEVIKYYRDYKTCSMPPEDIYAEHAEMLRYIREGDADNARRSLEKHFSQIREFASSVQTDLPRTRI